MTRKNLVYTCSDKLCDKWTAKNGCFNSRQVSPVVMQVNFNVKLCQDFSRTCYVGTSSLSNFEHQEAY